MNCENLKNVITQNTRITQTSKSTLDLCFTNIEDYEAGVLNVPISGHLPVFLKIYSKENVIKNFKRDILKRKINENTLANFKIDLNKINWNQELNSNDIEIQCNKFLKKVRGAVMSKTSPLN